jgi:hypothetical protein
MTPFKSYPIVTRQGGHTFSASYELVDGIVRVSSAFGSKSALVGTSAKVTAVRLLDEIVRSQAAPPQGRRSAF